MRVRRIKGQTYSRIQLQSHLLTGIHFFHAMCYEVINSGPDYDFLFITLLPLFNYVAQKLFWSVSAILLPYPYVWRLRRGMCWEISQLTESQPQLGPAPTVNQYGKRKCICAAFNILKVSKTFLNFLFFSTTQQPADLGRAIVIKCRTSFSSAFFNHQH